MNKQWRSIDDGWQYRCVNEIKAGILMTEYQFRKLEKMQPETAWNLIMTFLQKNAIQVTVITLEKGHFQGRKPHHKITVWSLDQLTIDLLEQYNHYGVYVRIIGNMDTKKLMLQARLYPNHFDLNMSAENNCINFLSLFL